MKCFSNEFHLQMNVFQIILLLINIFNVSGQNNHWQLLLDSVVTVTDKYFIQNRTVVISFSQNTDLQMNIYGIDTKPLHYESIFDINLIQIIDSLLESLHDLNHWPVIVSQPVDVIEKRDPTVWDTTNDDLHNSYIILTVYYEEIINYTLKDVKKQIEKLENYSAWNPRARFIIFLLTQSLEVKNVVKNILKELRYWEIMNAVVMVPHLKEIKEFMVQVYSWFPYLLPSGSCGKLLDIVLLDSWLISQGDTIGNVFLFPNRVPQDLGGCPMRASTFEFHPFIICDPKLGSNKNTSIIDGLEIRLIRCLANAMKMTLMLRIPPGDERGGIQLENGTWTGLRADIVYGEVDITFASLLSKLEDHLIFDDTRDYFTDRFTWFVARAKPYPRWLGMARVFSPSTWLIGFLSIILGGLLMRTLSSFTVVQNDEISPAYWNIVICISSIWAVFLGEGIPSMPRNASLRIFFLSMVIYSLAINTVFQTFFTSYVVNPGLLHQIGNTEELVSSDLIYAFYYVLDKFLTKDFLLKLKTRVFCEPFTCLDYVATKDNYATFCGRALLAYITDELVKQEGKHEIYAFREDSFQLNSVMLLPKGSHLLDRVNEVMTHIVEAGLPNQWLKIILDARRIKAGIVAITDLSDEYAPLTMNNLQGSFYFLLIGLALAIITFIIELLNNLKRNQKLTLKCKKKI